MNKILSSLFLLFFPLLSFAENSLSFAPPTTDMSVVFLGNVFGIVDGVLYGTGSQIMGNIFGVFNAAVLALGGIVIIYTLLVSTVNTAHEGEMLGKKWSSLWVPVRATLGLALLIPKASGYCVMQIFVMWVVIQGVGAADKVWDAALNYLNRGGTIVQPKINPLAPFTEANGSTLFSGAATILYGQVCMLGLQNVLTYVRQGYLNSKSEQSGPCYNPIDDNMKAFCETSVPDFINSVNTVTYQNSMNASNPSNPPTTFQVPMPNFDSAPYSSLNGLCGKINWNAIASSDITQVSSQQQLNNADLQTVQFSRAIAIQQMYTVLGSIARVMVSNDPDLSNPSATSNITYAYPSASYAVEQFGIPLTITGTICPSASFATPNSTCVSWGRDKASDTAPLFNGQDFQNAVAAYNAVMLPTLTLITQAMTTSSSDVQKQKSFLAEASAQGWILAGSYFFNLSGLNAYNTTTTQPPSNSNLLIDNNSGLNNSEGPNNLTDAFGDKTCQPSDNSGSNTLCHWLRNDKTKLYLIESLMDGSVNGSSAATNAPDIPSNAIGSPLSLTPQAGPGSSTVYGFVNNSLMVVSPNQIGTTAPNFVMNIQPSMPKWPDFKDMPNPANTASCGSGQGWSNKTFCITSNIVTALFTDIFVPLMKYFLGLVLGMINTVIMAFLFLPLWGITEIFQHSVSFIEQPDVNPIVALANMGVEYINFSSDLWIFLTMLGISSILLGPFGVFILVLIAMAMPLLLAWFGVMIVVGFTTAYFIPFYPYMIFTFGSIAWLMAVIEAMVAAPIVALGITHPEGEGPFGKGEHAVMILANVFLRPSLMIIGYIAGIILSYVSVWIINAGFQNILSFVQGSATANQSSTINFGFNAGSYLNPSQQNQGGTSYGYSGWASIYAYFFSILIYTSMYITVVQKSFTLIVMLPDKVLRWIGGHPEGTGQEVMQWSEEGKQRVEKGAEGTYRAQGQIDKQLGGYAKKGISKVTPKPGPDVGAS